jgi:hypothetical protein
MTFETGSVIIRQQLYRFPIGSSDKKHGFLPDLPIALRGIVSGDYMHY